MKNLIFSFFTVDELGMVPLIKISLINFFINTLSLEYCPLLLDAVDSFQVFDRDNPVTAFVQFGESGFDQRDPCG